MIIGKKRFLIICLLISFISILAQQNLGDNLTTYKIIKNILSKPCETKEEALKSVHENACIEFASYIESYVESSIGHTIIESENEIKERFVSNSKVTTIPIPLRSLECISYEFEEENPYIVKADYRMESNEIKNARDNRKQLYEEVQQRIKTIDQYRHEDNIKKCIKELKIVKNLIKDYMIYDPSYDQKFIDNEIRSFSFLEWLISSEKKEDSEFIQLISGEQDDRCKLDAVISQKDLRIFIIDNDDIFQVHPLPDGSIINNITYTYNTKSANIGILYMLISSELTKQLNGNIVNNSHIHWSKQNSQDFFDWYDDNFSFFDYVNYYFKKPEINISIERHQNNTYKYTLKPKSQYQDETKRIRRKLEKISKQMKKQNSEREYLYFHEGIYPISNTIKLSKSSISLISSSDEAVFAVNCNSLKECIKLYKVNKPVSIQNLSFNFYNYRMSAIYIKKTKVPVIIENCVIYSYNKIEKSLIKVHKSKNVEVNNCRFIQKNEQGFIQHVYKIEQNMHTSNYYVGEEIILEEKK